jgi:hypothetical protein
VIGCCRGAEIGRTRSRVTKLDSSPRTNQTETKVPNNKDLVRSIVSSTKELLLQDMVVEACWFARGKNDLKEHTLVYP